MRLIRTTQPVGAVGVDWSNPLTRGLTLAYLPTCPIKNLATGGNADPASLSTRITYPIGAKGRAFTGNGNTEDGVYIQQSGAATRPISSSTDWTIAVLAAPTNTSVKTAMFSQRNGGGNVEQIDLLRGTTDLLSSDSRGFQVYYRNTSGTPFYADNVTTHANGPDGLPHLWGGSCTASVLDIWRDGLNITESRSGTASGTFVSVLQTCRLGNLASFSTDGFYAAVCPMFLHLVWGARALSQAEWLSLARNPWQVFAPLPSRIYSPAAAAAGGFFSRYYYDLQHQAAA